MVPSPKLSFVFHLLALLSNLFRFRLGELIRLHSAVRRTAHYPSLLAVLITVSPISWMHAHTGHAVPVLSLAKRATSETGYDSHKVPYIRVGYIYLPYISICWLRILSGACHRRPQGRPRHRVDGPQMRSIYVLAIYVSAMVVSG